MLINERSHLDHGLGDAHVALIRALFGDRDRFFLETVELPEGLDDLMSGLHGPLAGDEPVPDCECWHAVRGGRPGPSRLCSRPPRPTRLMTVVGGPAGPHRCRLYSAWGGPIAQREPWDRSLHTQAERDESARFWAVHALSNDPA